MTADDRAGQGTDGRAFKPAWTMQDKDALETVLHTDSDVDGAQVVSAGKARGLEVVTAAAIIARVAAVSTPLVVAQVRFAPGAGSRATAFAIAGAGDCRRRLDFAPPMNSARNYRALERASAAVLTIDSLRPIMVPGENDAATPS
jgi:hypothetical protein